jgi:hypothetical protein
MDEGNREGSEVTDLVNRLRHRAKFDTAVSPYNLMLDAAEELEAAEKAESMMRDEITTLRKRCAELEGALKQCQSVLAMFIHPDTIMETTVLNAYALATAAEAKARSLVDGGTDAQQ